MLEGRLGRGMWVGSAALALLVAVAVPVAFGGERAAAPKVIGNPVSGKLVFTSWCAQCHTLKAAGSDGAIGPNFDKHKPPLAEATIVKAVTNGGSSVMTRAQIARYTTTMIAYKGALTPTQINDVAAFVYTSTNKAG